MFEKVKLSKYVTEHKNELDKIMVDLFSHYNELGRLDDSGKMQLIFLSTMIHIFLKTSGIPLENQKKILQDLADNL